MRTEEKSQETTRSEGWKMGSLQDTTKLLYTGPVKFGRGTKIKIIYFYWYNYNSIVDQSLKVIGMEGLNAPGLILKYEILSVLYYIIKELKKSS